MKKTAKASAKIFAEFLLGLLVIAFLAGSVLAWRLSQGPISLDKAAPYFVDYFNDNNTEKVTLDSLLLKWDGFEQPLSLSATNVAISNERGPFLFSPEIKLDLGVAALFTGHIDLKTVRIKNIILSITRQENGELTIIGQPIEETDENVAHDMATPALLTLNDLIYDLPEMDYFWIDDARIVYNDKQKGTIQRFEPVTLYIASNTQDNERKLNGFMSLPFGDTNHSNIVKLNFETLRDPLLLNINGSFDQTPIDNFLQFAPALPDGLDIDMTVSAEISVQLDNLWNLHSSNAVLKTDTGTISYPVNDTTQSVSLHDLSLSLTHTTKNDTLTINNLSVRLDDLVNLSVTGALHSIQKPSNMQGNVRLHIADLPHEAFTHYWPKDYTDNGAYRWLTHHIQGGVFPSVDFETVFDLSKEEPENSDDPLPAWLLSAKADFTYEDLTIDYHEPMTKATKTKGKGLYDGVELTLNIDEAKIGDMTTQNATLYFDDLISSGKGTGVMSFPLKAQAQQVFDYIAAKPINAFDKVDFKPVNTKGDVDAVVKISMPLLKDLPIEDVNVTVDGTLDNASIPNAVKGLTLAGGPYTIAATTGDIHVTGSGNLANQPITLDWHEYFSAKEEADYLSKIKANVVANGQMREAFIPAIASYFSGPTRIDLDYMTAKTGKTTSLDLTLDLKDTVIAMNEIGLTKAAGLPATATLNVGLKNGDLSTINNLSVKGQGLSLSRGDLNFKMENGEPAVTKATLSNIRYGTNNLSATAVQENNTLKANITGSTMDIRPLLSGDKERIEQAKKETKTTSRPIELNITVNEMQTAEKATLKQPKIYARLNGEGQIERFEMDGFLGKDNTDGKLHIRYTPDNADGLSLRVNSDNAGELLRTFDLYPYVQGGTLQIVGKPFKGGRFGDVEGRARINDFEVTNAPILVRLVNSLSFKNIMSGGALKFTRLESDFNWRIGDNGDVYNVSNGRSSGAAIALTFDGYVNTEKDDMKITGTAAPLSELNKMISSIPIVGQILTGGSAFWAATYSITGSPSDANVSVNPLSVITPGILRKLLFESTPDEEMPESETNPNE